MVHSTVPAIEAMKTQPGLILQQFLNEVIISGHISPIFKENDTISSVHLRKISREWYKFSWIILLKTSNAAFQKLTL